MNRNNNSKRVWDISTFALTKSMSNYPLLNKVPKHTKTNMTLCQLLLVNFTDKLNFTQKKHNHTSLLTVFFMKKELYMYLIKS
ncbi:hypothetical protein EAE89_02360 [Photorhabdus heterorhabditis]|uniref:Uncharacterized protein n=1 Tax=Photorhabdus heterorhabditis TaxID=880156 RepID=A0ABR5K7R9_9GAMM|nr:hypothetical protein AM629_18165 [Photorhabdus heterorhabditis]MBS9440624.1 hypothetical protein [Photorhabdus heterorhabditis]